MSLSLESDSLRYQELKVHQGFDVVAKELAMASKGIGRFSSSSSIGAGKMYSNESTLTSYDLVQFAIYSSEILERLISKMSDAQFQIFSEVYKKYLENIKYSIERAQFLAEELSNLQAKRAGVKLYDNFKEKSFALDLVNFNLHQILINASNKQKTKDRVQSLFDNASLEVLKSFGSCRSLFNQ